MNILLLQISQLTATFSSLWRKSSATDMTLSQMLSLSFCASGILAKLLNAVAMADSDSICSISTFDDLSKNSSKRSLSFSFFILCIICMDSFIGVSGFFISCVTCLAICFHAASRSDCASFSAESLSSSTIMLYCSTNLPISSSLSYCSFSFLPFNWNAASLFLIWSSGLENCLLTIIEIHVEMSMMTK